MGAAKKGSIRIGDSELSGDDFRARVSAMAPELADHRTIAIVAAPTLDTVVQVMAAREAGATVVPLSPDAGEHERRHVLRDSAATLLLEQEMRSDGRAATFAALAPFLDPHAEAPDRAALAAQLGVTTVAARVALHRFRGRYRQILVRVVADSLGGTEEVGEELRALAQALATG